MASQAVAPLQQLQRLLLDFRQRMTQASARLTDEPAAGAAELESVLAALPGLQADCAPLRQAIARDLADWPGRAEFEAWFGAELQRLPASIHLSLAMARYRLGDGAASAEHLRRFTALSAGQRDPQRAMALQQLARLALDAGRPDVAREHLAALEPEALSWTAAAAWRDIVPPGQEEAAALAAWRQVAAASAMRADVALAEGDREAYLARSAEAVAQAEAAGAADDVRTLWWARTSYELIWDATGQRLDRAEAEVRATAPAVVRDQPDFKRRLLQLRAQVWAARGRGETARRLLQQALDGLAPQDTAGWALRLDLADALSAAGDHAGALREARAALELARIADSPPLVRRCADHLRGLQLASGEPQSIADALRDLDAEPEDDSSPSDTASRLQTRVQLLLALQRPADALATVDRIAALAPAALLQSSIDDTALAAMRAAVLRADGQVAAAASVLEAAAEAADCRANGSAAPQRDRQQHWQTLTLGAALLRADLGDAEVALGWFERGREPLWRAALARHRLAATPLDIATLRDRLGAHRAAVLAFVVGRQRTAALVLPADGGAPWSRMLPIGEADWRERFTDLERGEASWNPRFADNLPAFSEWLGPLLADACSGAAQLCIVPEGVLSLVPFAGLQLPDGRPLALHCPSVLLPALRLATRAAPPSRPGRRLLSAGAGGCRSLDGARVHDFDAMATEVAQQFGLGAAQALTAAPLQRFLALAPGFDALHLSFHGNVQPGQIDPLAASTLEFQGGERLSARRLLELWSPGVAFEHVFVNACVSAGYAFARDDGAGGFWQALIEVGAQAVTGTLAYVDPAQAQRLALAFYRHWRPGIAVATALCEAQREMHRAGLPPSAWATHTTVTTTLGG